MLVSIILPTYNEKENIIQLVNTIHQELISFEHEIIVVDDNSPDGTFFELQKNKTSYLNPLLRITERGLAKSVRCGIENANGNIIVVMDSDFNHNPKHLPFMINAIEYYDFIAASRYTYGGGMYSIKRFYLSYCFNLFIRFITASRLTDHLSGFFCVKKATLEQFDFDKIFFGYGDYYLRLLFSIQRKKKNILQFPVIYDLRLSGESKTRFVKTFFKYIYETVKMVITFKK